MRNKRYSFTENLDKKRDNLIKESINCQILHVKEKDYSLNKENVIDECLKFLGV